MMIDVHVACLDKILTIEIAVYEKKSWQFVNCFYLRRQRRKQV
jgi:hypothetical protein